MTRFSLRRFLFGAPALLLFACSSSSGGTNAAVTDAGPSADSGDDAPVLDTTELGARGTQPTALASAKAVAGLFVKEDPTIDTAKSAGDNADAIAQELAKSTNTCAQVKITHEAGSVTVSADFGTTGCSIGSVGTVTGKVTVTVGATSGTVKLAFTFENVAVKGFTLNGTFEASTKNGTDYTFHTALTLNDKAFTFDGTMNVDPSAKAVTIDGTGTTSSASAESYELKGVHHVYESCYADAGSIAITQTTKTKLGKSVSVTETITFNADTPKTGKATLTVGGQTSPITLPSYGACGGDGGGK